MTTYANVTPLRSNIVRARSVYAADMSAGAVAHQTVRRSTRLRLTRRGRLVFGGLATAFVAGVLACAAMILAPGAVASGEQVTQEFPYVLVQPGDSLWSIASGLDPAADTRDVISEIVRLNQMQSAELQVGDTVAVPLRFVESELTFPIADLDG